MGGRRDRHAGRGHGGHDAPPDILTGLVHWLRNGGNDPVAKPDVFRRIALEGSTYCRDDGCEVVCHLKEFKVSPLCKRARYCGDACQERHWNAGGHKAACRTFSIKGGPT